MTLEQILSELRAPAAIDVVVAEWPESTGGGYAAAHRGREQSIDHATYALLLANGATKIKALDFRKRARLHAHGLL